jgi:hypothetical protein
MPMVFDEYLFADYSGAFDGSAQRKSIRLAAASRAVAPSIVREGLTRDDLVSELASRLKDASRRGMRVCFGQDHQYSIPFGLARALGLSGLKWREMLDALATGSYGESAPPFGHPKTFARLFNDWLVARGLKPYFYSATKAQLYGVPSRNPRDADLSCYRLTERCRSESGAGAPKPFNRVGDNGSVGGQSLVGMLAIRSLLHRCAREEVKVAVWPFDGLSIADGGYAGAHVMIEPYPSAVRPNDVAQSDESDALASAAHLRNIDLGGGLGRLLDLSSIRSADGAVVTLEGWIVSHQPDRHR